MSPLLCHGWASVSVPNDCTGEQSLSATLASIFSGSTSWWTWTAWKVLRLTASMISHHRWLCDLYQNSMSADKWGEVILLFLIVHRTNKKKQLQIKKSTKTDPRVKIKLLDYFAQPRCFSKSTLQWCWLFPPLAILYFKRQLLLVCLYITYVFSLLKIGKRREHVIQARHLHWVFICKSGHKTVNHLNLHKSMLQ